MGKWFRRILITLAVLAAIGAPAYYWYVVDSSAPSSGSYAIDMAEVRRLADSISGAKAQEVHVEHVATFAFPATAVVAGDGWDTRDLPVQSYQLVFPDHTAIIDTALDKQLGKDTTSFYGEAYDRMSAAMDTASLIVITHEHLDHIGGLARHPHLKQIMDVTKLTKEQIANPEFMSEARLPADVLASAKPLIYDRYVAVAPGVVLIKAPGHTPGSQMVFVQRADGAEILFLGDVAWSLRNVELARERARLVTSFFLREDHDAVMLELAELHRIHEAEPNLHIVPGHDPGVLADALKSGLFIDKFK